ncbi:MAG TPA: ABC transporter permease [Rubrobacteraceae bacterium]|nr:ABC transporter permease [Rubrobacteraceae bacterium]
MILTDRTFRTLLNREILRFTRVWMQTIVPQLLTSLLYLVVFGVALGGRIKEIHGIPYLEYILPGIALMSLITNSQMNSSWSVFDAKRERYIDEVLISPMSDLQITLAYSLGGMLRGVVMGAGVFLVGIPFVGLHIEHPLLLVLIGLLASFIFSSFGTMAGALATRIEHISFLTSVVIQPLAFLGGVFYSVQMLPQSLQFVTLLNPIFHTVDATRYATLGISDINPYPTIAIVFLLAALSFGGAWWAIHRGPNLRY